MAGKGERVADGGCGKENDGGGEALYGGEKVWGQLESAAQMTKIKDGESNSLYSKKGSRRES